MYSAENRGLTAENRTTMRDANGNSEWEIFTGIACPVCIDRLASGNMYIKSLCLKNRQKQAQINGQCINQQIRKTSIQRKYRRLCQSIPCVIICSKNVSAMTEVLTNGKIRAKCIEMIQQKLQYNVLFAIIRQITTNNG